MEWVEESTPVGELILRGGSQERFKITGDYYAPPSSFVRRKYFGVGDYLLKERVVPRWRRKIARGEQATSHQSGWKYGIVESTPSFSDVIDTSVTQNQTTLLYRAVYRDPMPTLTRFELPSEAWASATDQSLAENLAKQAFLGKLTKANRSMQTGVALGELRKTLRMVRNPVMGLWRATKRSLAALRKVRTDTLRKSRRKPKPLLLKEINDNINDKYLEETFGWAPLINDVEDAYHGLKALGDGRFGGEWVSAFFSLSRDSDRTVSSLTQANYIVSFHIERWREFTYLVKFYGRTEFLVDSPITNAAGRFGLLPRDFVATVWELIPYSFLIDYFSNAGEVIEGWSRGRAGLGWSSVSKRTEIRNVYCFTPKPYDAVKKIIDSQPGRFVSNLVSIERQPYGGSFMPQLRFELPGFGRKALNVASLAYARRADFATAARYFS